MIIQGDCLEVMRTYPDNHFSGIVCDPPYGLSFMNKGWDHGIPGIEYWKEALRICKPGSFILAFGGTRTYHRLTCAIEDAGWEIRDCISWLYGSGFPKSLNISKAIDKANGCERQKERVPFSQGQLYVNENNSRPWKDRAKELGYHEVAGKEAISDLSKQFDGFGTALKPAWEPIIMAMKPCDGTFAQNAEKHGQAGINIAESRIQSLTGQRPSDIISENEVIWEQERCLCDSCVNVAVLNLKQEIPEIKEFFATNHVAQTLREKGNFLLKDANIAVIGCFTGPCRGGTKTRPNRRHKFEHIKVWEDHFGPKPEGFVIHHINHDGFDNRIENLQLMRHADHIRHHIKKYYTDEDRTEQKRIYAARARERRKMAKQFIDGRSRRRDARSAEWEPKEHYIR